MDLRITRAFRSRILRPDHRRRPRGPGGDAAAPWGAAHRGIDRNAGTIAAVSVWDSEEHARFPREALREPIGRMRAIGVQFDEPEIYEIMEDDDAGT